MRKEIRLVDEKRGIVQVTTIDERFYARQIEHPETGLPFVEWRPSASWISSFVPQSKYLTKWIANKGWDEAEAFKNARGDEGSKVHQACSAVLLGAAYLPGSEYMNPSSGKPEPMNGDEDAAVISFMRFYDEGWIEAIGTEIVSFQEGFDVAGTIDLPAKVLKTIETTSDGVKLVAEAGEIITVDIKSSQAIYLSHEVQISCYRHMEMARIGSSKGAALQVGYRGNQREWKLSLIPDKYHLFQAAFRFWKDAYPDARPLQRDYPLLLSLSNPPLRPRDE